MQTDEQKALRFYKEYLGMFWIYDESKSKDVVDFYRFMISNDALDSYIQNIFAYQIERHDCIDIKNMNLSFDIEMINFAFFWDDATPPNSTLTWRELDAKWRRYYRYTHPAKYLVDD